MCAITVLKKPAKSFQLTIQTVQPNCHQADRDSDTFENG